MYEFNGNNDIEFHKAHDENGMRFTIILVSGRKHVHIGRIIRDGIWKYVPNKFMDMSIVPMQKINKKLEELNHANE